jgi:6-pyruvoyl-tetrahydropterin synthase
LKKEADDEVAKLLELKQKYKADVDSLETELILRHQHEEEERKAAITNEYIEKLAALFVDRIKPLLTEVLNE